MNGQAVETGKATGARASYMFSTAYFSAIDEDSSMHIDSPSLIDASDYDRYEALLAGYLAGRVAEATFVGERLMLGIYGQRQAGLCMVRTKIPGGRLPAAHLLGFAEALDRHSRHDSVHLSTRQNIQFYNVPLEDTARHQRDLGSFGIATREAGGNTVRNVTACPLAGICPSERVDVGVHVARISTYFAHNPLTDSLPRKFKIAVSGCGADCAQSAANDLGLIAETRDGRNGFRMLVGGGLGANPRSPVTLDEFVDEADLLPSIEAIITIHDRHSDRKRKARSRVKFLVEKFGIDDLRQRYLQAAARTRSAFDMGQAPRGKWGEPTRAPVFVAGSPRHIFKQRQDGFLAVPIKVPGGDLTAQQLRGLHALLERVGLTELRATSDQGLLIPHVESSRLDSVTLGLHEIGLGLPKAGDNVASCPGTATCQLGITASPRLARLLGGGVNDLRIRVNGCQNSCAQSDLADIGLYGKAKRHFGRMIPTYGLQLGGGVSLGVEGPEVPAARVPEAVRRISDAYESSGTVGFRGWVMAESRDYFDSLLGDLTEVREADLGTLSLDYGETSPFSVATSGVSECAGVQIEQAEKLKLDIRYEHRLRDAFVVKRKFEEAAEVLDGMVALGARLLLLSARGKSVDPANALESVEALLGGDPLAHNGLDLHARLTRWRAAPDELALAELITKVDQWLEGVGKRGRAPRPSSAAALRAVIADL